MQSQHLKAGVSALVLATAISPAYAQDPDPKALLQMSLSELSNIEVTSVSKRAEKASEAAAAIYVITQEDIARSGVTTIPEALRMAPGLDVAQSGNHQWAISSRGYNDQFANKLLVLIDGRTVYTPLFSGVNWSVQDYPLEDIDRIEVIRGPGATVWGANAVNGVINIITKKAQDTQGGVATAMGGNNKAGGSVRYGTTSGDTAYRLYAKDDYRDETHLTNHLGANDDFTKQQAGFRLDSKLSDQDTLALHGDAYYAEENVILALPNNAAPLTRLRPDVYHLRGGNVLGKWTRTLADKDEIALQVYVDNLHTNSNVYDQTQNTLDFDFQHNLELGERHQLTWGTGYRFVQDRIDGTFFVDFVPREKDFNLLSFFAQDKITLVPESVFLTVGSKFEHNDFSGFEYQPSARLSWLIDDSQTLWTSVSRAVRTPARSIDGVSLISGSQLGAYGRIRGDSNNESEEVIAYEAGYRIRPTENTSVDIATFYNDYDKLISLTNGALGVETGLGLPPRLVSTQFFNNAGEGKTWGGELAASWQIMPSWSVTGSYSLLQMSIHGSSLVTSEGKSPQHQFNLRSYAKLTDTVELDNMFYYVDRLRPTATTTIPDYVRADVRLAWKAMDNLELSLVGQNLLDDWHPEFSPFIYNQQAEVGRSVYANVKWNF